MKNLNAKIIDEIKKRLTNKEKAVHYLMDTLCIAKESAYRRLKSQIPFTFEEVVTIAQNLDFSIDKILGRSTDNRVFFDMPVDITQAPAKIFQDMLENSCLILRNLASSEKQNIIAAINQLPFSFLPLKTLFKYEYCHYLYTNGYIPLMTRFSDIAITPQMESLHEKCSDYFTHLRNVTGIIDNTFCSRIIKKIQYYHDLGLISNEDLKALQADLFKLFEIFETMVRTGKNHAGSAYSIYYSSHSIDSNSLYYEYDNKTMSQIWLYPESPIIIKNNPLICNMQKRWLESIIRNSMLITKSNNIQQIEILRDIHKQISELYK
ncbi:hypothetical protein FACS1894177_07040 [Bacteroidia bacterium]|nr:hypothetical protein FACS1894177_07040 [Bacteroidia bacterium]